MSDTALPAVAPPEPVDPRRALAHGLITRQFRLREVCSDMGIEPAQATAILLDPETQAHLNRLIGTGEYAGEVADARELLEIATSIARTTTGDFIAMCATAGSNDMGGNALGTQSIAGFLAVKLRAVEVVKRMKYPSFAKMLKDIERSRKRKGQTLDRASVHRAVSQLLGAFKGDATA